MTTSINIRNLVIALALAVVAVLLTVVYVGAARDDEAAGKKQVTVYAVTKNFGVGTAGNKIAGSLEPVVLAQKAAGPAPVTDPAQIKGLYLTQPVYGGEQLSLKRFAPPTQQGVRAQIAGNERAYQLPGSPNQLLVDTLEPGDKVDVVASLKNPQNQNEVKTAVVLRGLRVLDVVDVGENGALSGGAEGKDAVILAVTDRQGQRLYYVQKNGDWALQLRPVKKPKDSARSVDTFTTVLAGGGQ